MASCVAHSSLFSFLVIPPPAFDLGMRLGYCGDLDWNVDREWPPRGVHRCFWDDATRPARLLSFLRTKIKWEDIQ